MQRRRGLIVQAILIVSGIGGLAHAQLTDQTQTPNTARAGIFKSLEEQMGPGRGDPYQWNSSTYLIQRDPFRAIVRGRQLFQRKFTAHQGMGPRTQDGVGDIEQDGSIGAGLSDSCASCHSRPFGSAGFGGNVFTRPESRDAPHLFGLGLVEMLADEITADLRAIRAKAITQSQRRGRPVAALLESKGIVYGSITAFRDGSVDTSLVEGVDADLRVRPFFAEGRTISIREFVVGALNAEMGLEAFDPDTFDSSGGRDVMTPAGMWLRGSLDVIEPPPASSSEEDPDGDGITNEAPAALADYLEFYLLNYFKPAVDEARTKPNDRGLFEDIGCATCHVPDLTIDFDRRVADVETRNDPKRSNGVFNGLFATATPLFVSIDDGTGLPPIKQPLGKGFVVKNIFADFKRHDLGPEFHERNFDGSVTTHFMTEPLWGVASTPPYGHDGRSQTLRDVIVRHGGEASESRERFFDLSDHKQARVLAFLESLTLFSPPDTSSNLDLADRAHPDFPFQGRGSLDLSVLFNDPTEKE
ncbi:MAG: di-heme oxidoredictase family protein [Planctomycetota bacterium]